MKQRRQYLIKKSFQVRFIIKFCLIVIAASLIMGSVVYFHSGKTLTTAFVNSRLKIVSTRDFILPILIYSFLITVALISILTIAVVLLISHKIAGPLYRVEKILNEMGKGSFPSLESIKLRKKDELKSLAEAMKNMVVYLKEKTELLNKVKHELTLYEESLESSLEINKDEYKDRLHQLKEKVSEVIDSFSFE